MCCSTGICGPEVDIKLVQFAADLDWLKAEGVIVQRHNLSQNPAAFVENELVKTALTEKGEAALPVILLNGKVATTGRYPDHLPQRLPAGASSAQPTRPARPVRHLPRPRATLDHPHGLVHTRRRARAPRTNECLRRRQRRRRSRPPAPRPSNGRPGDLHTGTNMKGLCRKAFGRTLAVRKGSGAE